MKINVDMICLISSIMDKLNIDTNAVNKYFEMGKAGKGKSKEQTDMLAKKIGMQIMVDLGKKLHLIKGEITQFIALYKNISEEEAKNYDLLELFKEISKDEGLKSFLKKAATPEQKKK